MIRMLFFGWPNLGINWSLFSLFDSNLSAELGNLALKIIKEGCVLWTNYAFLVQIYGTIKLDLAFFWVPNVHYMMADLAETFHTSVFCPF